MAGNYKKFIDRSPIICAAGKPIGDPNETAEACLKDYRLVHEVEALKHDAGIYEEHLPPCPYKLPKLENKRHVGIYTESKPLLQPPIKTRYQSLINDLKETAYDSYWNKLEGRSRDPIPALPAGMDTIQTTFGRPLNRVVTAKDLLNPPKTVYEVLWDSQVGHEMYKKTHNDYNPGEQLNRSYLTPAYNCNQRFGKRTTYDPRGIWARCAIHNSNNNPLSTVDSIQANVIMRQKAQLGKVFAPNNIIECVPREHMFGKPSGRPMYSMAELLKDPDCPPCLFKRDFQQWIAHLNKLRVHAKRQCTTFGFDFKTFQDHITYYDKDKTGWVPLDLFYKLCECYNLHYQYECLEPLFNLLGVIQENVINYIHFLDIVDMKRSALDLMKIEDIPKNNQYYISEMHSSACDYLRIDNSNNPAAGVPAIRNDNPKLLVPKNGCLADLENLPEDTTAGAVVNPSIYTHYGVTTRDLFRPRSPEKIKMIFENIGYEFPNDTFDKLWQIALKRDNTGLVCVESFKKLINETVPPPRFIAQSTKEC